MASKIFVNLPVKDLERSMAFFAILGFGFNKQFTNENAACMVVTEDIYVMLLVEPFFKSFTPKALCDSSKSTEVLLCIALDSRIEVEEMVRKAIASGGSAHTEPQDHGFMYAHSFQDPDGHVWEPMYMDPTAVRQEQAA